MKTESYPTLRSIGICVLMVTHHLIATFKLVFWNLSSKARLRDVLIGISGG
jgi:hypothetical protein